MILCAGHRPVALFFLLIPWLCSCSDQTPPTPEALFFVEHVRSSEDTFKRVDLASLRGEGYLAAPVTVRADTRVSLTPPLPSRLDFTVDLPLEPVVRFSIATATPRKLGDDVPVVFRILLRDEGGQEIVFREVVKPRRRNRWLDREVRLDAWAESTVRLTFEAKLLDSQKLSPADVGEVFPLWANPVLASGRRGGEATNIILIVVDCLRADHVGVYGYPQPTTPNIDRLANDGVVFDKAFATAESTLPTHMSMFTGLLPSFHGASNRTELSRSVPYISELLRESSFQVDAVVSGGYLSQHFGFHRGFHTYHYLNQPHATEVIDLALGVLERAAGSKNFLFVHLGDVHWPYRPAPDFLERFQIRPQNTDYLLDKVIQQKAPDGPQEVAQIETLYDAEIAYADEEIGRFFDELKKSGLYDSSLIMVTADHGEAFYEHGRWQHSTLLYDENIHIPLVVKWPGNSVTGRVAAQVSQTKIFNTILEEAGIGSESLGSTGLKHFAAEQKDVDGAQPVVSECIAGFIPEAGAIRRISLRADDHKYIATFKTTAESQTEIAEVLKEELYDLARDPGELRNLLQEEPPDIELYRQQLDAYLSEAREFERGRKGETLILDETMVEHLKSLGYVDVR